MYPQEYFDQNPEANICFSALGLVKATREEAEALIGGTKEEVTVHERVTVSDTASKEAAEDAAAEKAAAELKAEEEAAAAKAAEEKALADKNKAGGKK